ncbi:hypothetical protein PVK06_038535 [Gossypium arboreum]|uniref:Uncharacterized protein n=1 Tax=Gossypium arboreum TaxID=29729 RepID=A0ABR0N2F5_GOSAR|nr:hypothetical protein PVK06_038535 [Gossypium arboreum]
MGDGVKESMTTSLGQVKKVLDQWRNTYKIEQLEEEKMQSGLDVDVQNLEANKLRKRKNKFEEDLDSLKTDYKKLRLSMRIAGLGINQNNGGKRSKKKKIRPINEKINSKMPKFEKIL